MIVIEINKGRVIVRKWNMKDIEEAVYVLVQLIPIGCVTTYKDIANVLKLSPRLVAKILSRNRNPIAIPCHRVIKSDGKLGGYTLNGRKAPKLKELLLRFEGFNSCIYSLAKLLEAND
ncbi:MAG: MGMT family protein [Ignisphaera sp.]